MIQPITSIFDAFSLKGKNAVITGGNRGLGYGIAEAYAQAGANIAILCRDAQKAAEAIDGLKQYGGKYESFSCDVTSIESCRKAVADVCASFGSIDILVNNSGVSCTKSLLDMDEELSDWYRVVNTDLNGTVHMTYEVAKRMRDAGKGGVIVNVASNAAFMVNKGQPMSPYSSAKAAVVHFTRCMAVELSQYDIRVNGIAPGFTNSELSKHIPKDNFVKIIDQTPARRFGEPIEFGAL
ncbi:MAG: SDR family oxidoreductase, partial [Oscillospiraceae bacterium]|nr:SDR family oxidoreductase [Oscillospiraceae bacterium]